MLLHQVSKLTGCDGLAPGDLLLGELGLRGDRGDCGVGCDSGRRAGGGNALGRRLVGRVIGQDLQVTGRHKMPPQKGLHPVFRRHGFMDDFPLTHLRTARDSQGDWFLRRNQAASDREPRHGLGS